MSQLQRQHVDDFERHPLVDDDDDDVDSFIEDSPEKQYRITPRPRGPWKIALFFSCVIVTILALTSVALSLQPTSHIRDSTESGQGHHSHNAPGSHKADDNHVDPSDVVHYHEDAPASPQLRDTSDYILDRSWDLDASPATREYHWTITDGDLNPDGIYRPMMLINNQFPGPLVECNDGDTIIVNVDNRAVNATAIHFHGLYQNGTNNMDGAVGVTQCAIAPGTSFTYRFVVRGQSGTYWYHAHQGVQSSDGLLGPVVIHSKDEPALQELSYDSDRVVMVQDHYHNTTSELLMEYMGSGMENEEPVPDNALINGRGMRSCEDFPGWPCDSSNTSTPTFDLAYGKRHRLRIINVGAFAEFQMQFDEHAFYVTEVDGTDVHPEPFHRLNILPAQRYSVVLEANSTTAAAFWLRARMVSHCFATANKHLESEIRGIVRYTSPDKEVAAVEPTSKDWPESIEVQCRDLNTSALHPVQHATLPPATDHVNLRASFRIGAWRLSRGYFNDSSWLMNGTHPSLHRFIDSAPDLTTLDEHVGINNLAYEHEHEYVLQTTGIRTVDITINNFDDGAHPFHLHGHKFFVVVQGQSAYPPSPEKLPAYLEAHGLGDNPLRRDTVTVEGYGWAVIRVVLDNPGLWTLHCHNMWHAESGMVMQVLVRSEVVSGWGVTDEERDMCRREGVMRGMRPDDSIWAGSFG